MAMTLEAHESGCLKDTDESREGKEARVMPCSEGSAIRAVMAKAITRTRAVEKSFRISSTLLLDAPLPRNAPIQSQKDLQGVAGNHPTTCVAVKVVEAPRVFKDRNSHTAQCAAELTLKECP